MRSRSTNVLQIIIMIIGLIYMVIGFSFYISPINILNLFVNTSRGEITAMDGQNQDMLEKVIEENSSDVNFSENWLKQVMSDEILAPLYFIFRILAALLFTAGLSMIMPLFDPLKYRGMIYFNGIVFPGLASVMFLINFISLKSEAKGTVFSFLTSSKGHLLVSIVGIIFIVILILAIFGIVITKKQTEDGVE